VLQKAVETLPARLITDRAKALAVPRIQTLQLLLGTIESEAGRLLF